MGLPLPTIAQIAEEINRRAATHAIGQLQEIRRQLRGLQHLPTRNIFSARTTFELYAFHVGGRTELQFNIGLEVVNDVTYLRHGVAFSLEPNQTLPEITPLIPKIARFNEFLRTYPDELSDLRMWWYDARDTRSTMYPPVPIPPELVRRHNFIFLGALASAADPNYDLILGDFDRLLPCYRYVEGSAPFPSLADLQGEFHFIPGCSIKPSRTSAVVTGRELDVQLRHNDLQLALYEHLVSKHGEAVGTELGNGAGARVDVVVKADGRYLSYEIKTALSARACIREALAQLLEYSFWPGAREAESLLIVGEPPLDSEADAFLRKLRERFGLPIHYQQFDFQARRLVE